MKTLMSGISTALLSLLAPPMAAFAGQDNPPAAKAEAPHGANQAMTTKPRVMEGYPNRIQARLEQRNRSLRNLPANPGGLSPRSIINLSKRWNTGQTLTVAFKGGDAALYKQIADTVTEWTKYANLTFDFVKPGSSDYRTWSPSDKTFTANIRVSFDQSGYYSLVGNDSTNRQVTRPGEESLNLSGFDQDLPSDWQAVARHEFGHAIGFEHEHQSPVAPCDFRFDDDPGYVATTDSFGQFIADSRGRRPGLYTTLGGPPNNWPQAVVDFNLKQLPDSHAYDVSPFDKDSIMKYFFDASMFVAGASSACFTSHENLAISAGDQAGAARVYPRAAAAITASAQLRMRALKTLTEAISLPETAKAHFQDAIRELRDH